MLALGAAALVAAVIAVAPDPVAAFQARGGSAIAVSALVVFLWWRWIEGRRGEAARRTWTHSGRLLVAIPVAFVVGMALTNVQPIREWSRSLDAFRAEVDRTQGVAPAIDVLPANRRDVLWGWTATSLSLVVRGRPDAGVLVDRNPAVVPFPAEEARAQIADDYVWSR